MKKIFCMILSFCLSFIPSPVLAQDFASVASTMYYENLMMRQEGALKANEALWKTFYVSPEGEVSYHDTYAGAYIEKDKLCVCLTDVSEKNIEYYNSIFGDLSKFVNYIKAEYSYKYLYNSLDQIDDELFDKYGVKTVCVSDVENKIIIEANENNAKNSTLNVVDFLKNTGLPYEVITTENGHESITSLNSKMVQGRSLYFVVDNANYIHNDYFQSQCTLGMCGGYSGKAAIVSSGHAFSINDTISYTGNMIPIGSVVYKRYSNNSTGDFCIIEVDEDITLSNVIANTYSITGVYSNPPVGTTVKTYGATTHFNYGTVVYTNKSSQNDNGYLIKGLTFVDYYSNKTLDDGDSGAPCFITDSSTGAHSFCGIIAGDSNGRYFCFTPYVYINAVGFASRRN